MQRSLAAMLLAATLLLPVGNAIAGKIKTPINIIGTLTCKIVPHSGVNLLIHSVRDIRCEFKPRDGSMIECYKGEMGIGLGIDVHFNKNTSIRYSVLANHFQPGTHQLAGKYSGVSGGVTLGINLGNNAPIGKRDGSISLQPISGKSSGGSVAAGFNYLYLEADK